MIKVLKMEAEEFRGIRSLAIDFRGENFAICGRNGTGKSGIVDALEFGLTGNVSRLSGKGTGDVSLRDHAPHVDRRNRPDKAKVKLTVQVPNVETPVTIERTVNDPLAPVIIPSAPAIIEHCSKWRCIPNSCCPVAS
jgi:DNA repair exonuclease SbcCD ATPase subunit